ncbi:TetR/AcrR family transcriptional regulator [Glycomyces sp. L485]|uniref:TetR/AcrR family transcriptional regulator n=1 Tax=Glycomyces sp. L485 TaxID=2909235 RepID=UPI001F4BA7BE|nr:TetR/AcrR family transcriptional regulator [Glycomyces sp. L485]MCH7232317.1 TetR/AcrR family transcriptional regulator [Glycomyces sp. L485]
MPRTSKTSSEGASPTFAQRHRRAQIIEKTIELVAEKGYAGVSLSGIAERAGITKPAVLYHFSSKAAVVDAAYEHVLHELVSHVGAAVEAASAEEGPAAYASSMIEYLSVNRRHTRMIIEALSNSDAERDTAARWKPLAQLIQAARRTRGLAPDPDSRTTALIIGGAIDAIVTEKLQDPAYDTRNAAAQLTALIDATYTP